MGTVNSKDGTNIAFEKVGSGPAAILVNGALSYHAFEPTLGQLAERLGKALPHARHENFEGQTHSFDPRILAPSMIEFFNESSTVKP